MSSFATIASFSNHPTPDLLLDCFHNAATRGNLVEYFSCFAISSTFLGTDINEYWTGEDFFQYAHSYFTGEKPAWIYVPVPSSRKYVYFPSKESPAFATFDEWMTSESFALTCRGTGTLIYENNRWLIASYQLTFPIPNDLAKDLCKKIFLFERQQTITSEAARADSIAAELLAECTIEEMRSNEKASKSKSKNRKKK
jgi:hypothetical protein